MVIIIALVSGVLGLILSFALRRDTERAHKFRTTGGFVDERFVLLSLPGFSMMLVGAGFLGLLAPGVGGWLGNVVGWALMVACGAVVVAGLYLSVLGMGKGKIPEALKPEWMRGR